MPRLKDLERFKRDLAGLSRESEILEQWGEQREDLPLPEGPDVVAQRAEAPETPGPAAGKALPSLGPDLGMEPQPPPETKRPAKRVLPAVPEEGLPPDFETLLNQLPLEGEAPKTGAEAGAGEGAQEGEPAELEELGGFDLEELAPLTEEEGALPGFEEGPSAGPGLVDHAEKTGAPLPGLEEEPQAAPIEEIPAEMAPETAEPVSMDEFAIPDLGGFPLGGEAEAGTGSLPETPAWPEPSAEPSAEPPAEPSAKPSPVIAEPPLPAPGGAEGEGFGLGVAGGDAFESFSLDTTLGEANLGGEDLDSQLASLGEEIPTASTFNLEKDWGAGFEIPGGPEGGPAPSAKPARERPQPASTEKVRPVSLTEEQVDRLQDRLLSFPLNLRLAVEDAIANKRGTEGQLSRLVWALVERRPFDEVAALVSRMLKRHISVPEGYEKSTGAAFEEEKGSFRWVLVHTVAPIARTTLIVLAALALLGWLGWRYVYRPIAADALYRSGYAHIAQDRYAEAEDSFARATSLREFVAWYYRYAQAYVNRRQYLLAERKYADLLARHPGETKGALEWASLERLQLKYAEAVKVLDEKILRRDYLNRDALLLEGDVYLDWADEAPAHYEDARRSYATLIQNYGMQDLYLERMLLYFMRTDNLKEVQPLVKHFLASEKMFPSAATLAELGGYLFDKDVIENVHRILDAAEAKDRTLPEVHYQLARYFHRADSPENERRALDNSIGLFQAIPMLSRRREGMFIDSYLMRADWQLAQRQYIGAEADYSAAAAEYGRALDLGRIGKTPRFAAAWAGLGEVAYWQRDDLASALNLFEHSAAEGWDSPGLRYERGCILYRQGRMKEAAEQFYEAGKGGSESPYLLYAFGSALYARQDFSAAEGYFRRTVDAMNTALDQLNLPAPQEKASHAEIMELLMEAQNNLGASLYRVSARTGDARRRALAVEAFTESTRLYDSLSRDQVPMPRAGSSNLGLGNLDALIQPQRGAEPSIYTAIEKGIDFPKK